jgi:uncharacterized membrane protein SpoIIM required for sporulation
MARWAESWFRSPSKPSSLFLFFSFIFYFLFYFIPNYFESYLNLNMSSSFEPLYTNSNLNVEIYFYFLIFLNTICFAFPF